jgi:hypothetical protein
MPPWQSIHRDSNNSRDGANLPNFNAANDGVQVRGVTPASALLTNLTTQHASVSKQRFDRRH